MTDRYSALDHAARHANRWLDSLATRPVPARASVAEVVKALGTELPAGPAQANEVIDLLASACDPGLTAMPSGRFYGMVIGGTHPAALAADWLVSAWDQNAVLRAVSPAHAAVEDVTSRWLLDLLGLPETSGVGFVTGATMSIFTCLAAARDAMLAKHGWDVAVNGLSGSPRVHVLVGAQRHDTVDLALRYLGLGAPVPVRADHQGRVDPGALVDALRQIPQGAPVIVVLQAGNLHSGAFDPFADAIAVARDHGAWVHIDGAFGLFAAASPTTRHLTDGYDQADSWTTDAHKTLNVPYDCGIAIVADRNALRTAMTMGAMDYFITDAAGDPCDTVPESSRRARAIPVWAVLRALGRQGVADLVDGFCRHAKAFAEGIEGIDGARVENDVVFSQVSASFGSDERTVEVSRRLMADGTAWMTGSRWHDKAVLRISVSNWSTTDEDVARSLDALRRAAG
ncbi:MAG: aspartate aminotransferase family protein [Actinomycetia bacterium]|jgi:glutamate/tyrosine decarboxylase-like PLP-dependent enzyme|nr:aspartate aminotransferase family protein [Actinomycetes bacterium]